MMAVERAAALACAWLASYFLHSSLLLGIALIGTRRMGPRLDRVAEQIWRAALVLPIVTAQAQQWILSTHAVGILVVDALTYSPPPLAASHVPGIVWIAGALIWVAGALVGLVQLNLCHRRLQRQIRHRKSLPAIQQRRVSSLLPDDDTQVSIVEGITIPFALVSEICLPTWLVDRMTVAELRAVIAHEAAHLRRRDALWRPAVSAFARTFFFQPLNWIARDRLRELSEYVCDSEAVASTRSPISLAVALEMVASRALDKGRDIALAPAMGAPVSLTLNRTARILDGSPQTSPPPLRIRPAYKLGGGFVACVFAIIVAPRVILPAIAFQRYTIDAEDLAGRFTVTVEKGRVVGATIAGRSLDRRHVIQDGSLLALVDNDARVLSLRMTAEGGIRWEPRTPIEAHR
jgi:Zn-dependent protease with chaperone function